MNTPEPESPTSLVGEAQRQQRSDQQEHESFKPGFGFHAAFWSILIVFLAFSLDATSLSVALPVSCAKTVGHFQP